MTNTELVNAIIADRQRHSGTHAVVLLVICGLSAGVMIGLLVSIFHRSI